MGTVKLFLHSAKMLIKCQAEYPVSFLLNTLSQLVMMGGELLAVVLIVDRFTGLKQWTGNDLFFFFGVLAVTFYLVEFFFRGITAFDLVVRNGSLDTMLLRPRGILTQVLCYTLDIRRIGAIAIGIAACLMGGREIIWTFPKVLALGEAFLMGGMLIAGLFLIEACFCIRSIKSVEMVNILTYGGRSACQYPIDIYPLPLRILFIVVAPFALTTHMPVSYILGKNLFGWPDAAAFIAPLAGGIFFLLMYVVFRLGLRAYSSTGS